MAKWAGSPRSRLAGQQPLNKVNRRTYHGRYSVWAVWPGRRPQTSGPPTFHSAPSNTDRRHEGRKDDGNGDAQNLLSRYGVTAAAVYRGSDHP